MKRLILSVSIPALLLAGCAASPAGDAIYGLAPDRVEGPLEPQGLAIDGVSGRRGGAARQQQRRDRNGQDQSLHFKLRL